MPADNLFDVSIVVTVFNKERYITDTVRSLTQQDGHLKTEYVFIDDVSTDNTLAVLEECTRDVPNVVIIRNQTNEGPSIRLNQAVAAARGKYVLCFDSDDILAANAVQRMFELLEANEADVIYGQWEKTTIRGAGLIGKRVPDDALYEVSDKPLEFVLHGRFLRMALMARRDVFLAAGGADERIFIQDESLPLRLAAVCKKFIALSAPIMFVPLIEGALSGNKSQLNHDRFLANYYVLRDHKNVSMEARSLLYRRCVSAAWKQRRLEQGARAVLSALFGHYVMTKLLGSDVHENTLAQCRKYFAGLTHVRRTKRA